MNVLCIHLGFSIRLWDLNDSKSCVNSGRCLVDDSHPPLYQKLFFPCKLFFVQLHECYSCKFRWLFSQTSRTDISIVLELFSCIHLSQILATPAFLKVSGSPTQQDYWAVWISTPCTMVGKCFQA